MGFMEFIEYIIENRDPLLKIFAYIMIVHISWVTPFIWMLHRKENVSNEQESEKQSEDETKKLP